MEKNKLVNTGFNQNSAFDQGKSSVQYEDQIGGQETVYDAQNQIN